MRKLIGPLILSAFALTYGAGAMATGEASMTDTKQPQASVNVLAGAGQQDAVDLGHGIYMSRDVTNLYLVTTDDGSVLISTGIVYSAKENKRRIDALNKGPLRRIIFTQSHEDHIGGWNAFNAPGVETIAQKNFGFTRGYFTDLKPAMARRSRRLWASTLPQNVVENVAPVITTSFDDNYAFEQGGRKFELYSVRGGETTDSLIVWMPAERIAFTGNMMGPVFGHVPNLYTLRGDRIRYVQWYLDSVQRLIDLNAETLITGHGEPIVGAENIRAELTKVRDAVQYIRDATFAGMNEGKDLWTLMRDIKLPPHLDIGQGHGKVSWIVRAIWEEHLGWFRFESSTELYATPVQAVLPDFVEMAGGAGPVLARGRAYLDAGDSLKALHMAEAVLTTDAANREALTMQRDATQMLLDQSVRSNFSEVRWLEADLARIDALLAEQ